MWTVQVSKYPTSKSGYISKLVTHFEAQARLTYQGYNIGYGYRKRLLFNGRVIAHSSKHKEL